MPTKRRRRPPPRHPKKNNSNQPVVTLGPDIPQVLRLPLVTIMTALSRSTIWRKVRRNELGTSTTCWAGFGSRRKSSGFYQAQTAHHSQKTRREQGGRGRKSLGMFLLRTAGPLLTRAVSE